MTTEPSSGASIEPSGSPPELLKVHPDDNVAIAVEALRGGEEVAGPDGTLVIERDIPAGHKVALRPLALGQKAVRYGAPIGALTMDCPAGGWVHSHNLRTLLEPGSGYCYEPSFATLPAGLPASFLGYRRGDGRVGVRNELWVLNTVGCVNRTAERIAAACNERFAGRIDGAYAFSHPYGCSQLGDDLAQTRRVLAGLMRHPNAGGVLIIGLGCENNQLAPLLAEAGDLDLERVRFFNAQEVEDEIETGLAAATELVGRMALDRRIPCGAEDLVVGVKCGGSDAFSGLTANALVGAVTDRLTALGGTVVLTEVPEMFGAEHLLMNRARDSAVFAAIVAMIDRFKAYFVGHGQPVYENPSPGNKDGGLTTLEEKSLGAVQKGGRATVCDVLRYGEPVRTSGLVLLEAPGNDAVSATAAIASGATVLLFTTGRGTPLGFPVPTLKIASNSALAQRKPGWIDFDAGPVLAGTGIKHLADDLFALVLKVASGETLARNEVNGVREIAIWKDGVTL